MHRKLQPRFGGSGFLDFYNEPPKYNYNFCYINCNKNYIINDIGNLFSGNIVNMFTNGQRFLIHPQNETCPNLTSNDQTQTLSNSTEKNVNQFISENYPKNKYLHIVFKILLKKDLINNDLFFKDFSNLHIVDFCAFINNRFGKKDKTDVNLLKFCKYLKTESIRFPKVCIKNPVASVLIT